MTNKKVYVTTDYHEKTLQRALLQYSKPENANLVREALKIAGREELIGTTPDCLVRPAFRQGGARYIPEKKKSSSPTRQGTSYTKNSASAASARTKKTKFDRIFGEDAGRIKREAAEMTLGRASGRKKSTQGAKKPSAKYSKGKKH